MLRALKNTLDPSDQAQRLEVEQRYRKLCKGPGIQDLEAWLDEWIATYTKARELAILEVDGTRPIKDFLVAARLKRTFFCKYSSGTS